MKLDEMKKRQLVEVISGSRNCRKATGSRGMIRYISRKNKTANIEFTEGRCVSCRASMKCQTCQWPEGEFSFLKLIEMNRNGVNK